MSRHVSPIWAPPTLSSVFYAMIEEIYLKKDTSQVHARKSGTKSTPTLALRTGPRESLEQWSAKTTSANWSNRSSSRPRNSPEIRDGKRGFEPENHAGVHPGRDGSRRCDMGADQGTPGVSGFVGPGKTPTALTDDEVKNILGMMEVSGEAPRPKIELEKGDRVKVIDGPF